MESVTDIKADINKTYRCVSDARVHMGSVTVTLRDATIQAYLSGSNFSREGEDPAGAPAPSVGKAPCSLRLGSDGVRGKAGRPSALVMEWMGSGGQSLHRGLAHHSPTQAGGPGVPLRKTTSPSCEMSVLTSQGAWGGPGVCRECPGHRTACCLLRPTPYILLVSSQVTVGEVAPPTLLLVPALPGGSEWPGAGLHGNPVAGSRPGPSCSQWGCKASRLCTANR